MQITLNDARLMQGEHHADSLHLSAGSLPENAEVRLAFLTPRGRRCESPAVELTDGEGDFSLPQSLLDGAGRLLVQLLAETDDRLLKSEVFAFDVEKSIDATGETPEEGFFSLSGVCRRLDALAFDLAAFNRIPAASAKVIRTSGPVNAGENWNEDIPAVPVRDKKLAVRLAPFSITTFVIEK